MRAELASRIAAALSPAALAGLGRSLAIGGVGGALFALAGLPAPWLSGAGLAAAVAAVAGVKIEVPGWLRGVALVVLGVIAGSAVTPESIAMIVRWPLSLAGLAICVALIMVSVSLYLERVHGYDRATSRLSAVPGALPYVLAMAAQCEGADVRRVAIIQVVRLAALLILLPSVLIQLGVEPTVQTAVTKADAPLFDLALILAGGTAAGWVFARLGVPAGWLFGPMLGAAAITGSGVAENVLPAWLTIPGLLVMGTIVGSNFAGLDLVLLRSTLLAGLGSVLVGAGVGIVCAWPVASILGLPVAQVWLAYAPGSVDTMTVLALALGLDVAYVGGHHALRFIGLGFLVPYWLREHVTRA